MSYGIGAALAKAYTYLEDPNESVNREKETLAQLRTLKLQDDEIKKKADLDAAAYQAEISKFADTLLGPDKERINERSKRLSGVIKEKMRLSGGADKFLASGGHSVLSEYKNSVINSSESNTYLENKKNSELIIKAQMENMGHRINSRDLKSLVDYKENKGGVITFTGLLNEVEINPDDYNYGEDIPAEDVLRKNYMAIVGNYALDNPDAPMPPSETELLSYTALKHGGKGTNYKRNLELRRNEREELQFAYDLRLKEEQIKATKAKTEAYQRNGVNADGTPKTKSDTETPKTPKGKILMTTQAAQSLSYMSKGVSTVSEIPKNPLTDIPEVHQMAGIGAQNWNKKFKYFNPGEGNFFEVDLGANAPLNFGKEFTPRGAFEVLGGMKESFAGAVLFGKPNENGTYDNLRGNTVTAWSPGENSNVYMSNGASTDGMEIKERGSYEIEGVISAYKVSNKDNKSSIVMNVYDDDKDVTDQYEELTYDKNDTPKPGMFIVMKNKKNGNVYYVDTKIEDPASNNILHQNLGEINDIGEIVESGDRVRKDNQEADARLDAALQPLIDFRDRNVEGDSYKAIYNEYKNNYITSEGVSKERLQLVESFYLITAALIAEQSGTSPDVELNKLVRNGYFTKEIVEDIGIKTGIDIAKMIRNPEMSNRAILEFIRNTDPDASQPETAYAYDYILRNFELINRQ